MKITVVGMGINPVNDLPISSFRQMKNADKLVVVTTDEDAEGLRSLGLEPENIMHLYQNGDVDRENYERILDYLIQVAIRHGDVVFGIPGNPWLGVTLMQMLRSRQEMLGFQLEALPGISSFDWMMLGNGRDPLDRGTILIDANRLLLFGFELDPTLDCYIYHVCSVGTSKTWIDEPSNGNRIDELKRELMKFYPEDHLVTLVSMESKPICYSGNANPGKIAEAPIKSMEEILDAITFDATLFIKGLKPARLNLEFLERINSERTHISQLKGGGV